MPAKIGVYEQPDVTTQLNAQILVDHAINTYMGGLYDHAVGVHNDITSKMVQSAADKFNNFIQQTADSTGDIAETLATMAENSAVDPQDLYEELMSNLTSTHQHVTAAYQQLAQGAQSLMSGSTGVDTPVGHAISQATSDPRVQLAMKMGAMLEGGNLNGGWKPGDNGSSFGPFQIHLPDHPDMTAEAAQDPQQAVNYMLSSYEKGVSMVDPQLWESNPAKAASMAAYFAERPAEMYPMGRVNDAYGAIAGQGSVPGNQAYLTAQAITHGAVPGNLAAALSDLGDQSYNQLCEKFVEGAGGSTGQYASAVDAWQNQPAQQRTDFQNMQPGDQVYFAPSDNNQGYGHVGIYMGNGAFVSATDSGVKVNSLQDWSNQSAPILGFIPGPDNQSVSPSQGQLGLGGGDVADHLPSQPEPLPSELEKSTGAADITDQAGSSLFRNQISEAQHRRDRANQVVADNVYGDPRLRVYDQYGDPYVKTSNGSAPPDPNVVAGGGSASNFPRDYSWPGSPEPEQSWAQGGEQVGPPAPTNNAEQAPMPEGSTGFSSDSGPNGTGGFTPIDPNVLKQGGFQGVPIYYIGGMPHIFTRGPQNTGTRTTPLPTEVTSNVHVASDGEPLGPGYSNLDPYSRLGAGQPGDWDRQGGRADNPNEFEGYGHITNRELNSLFNDYTQNGGAAPSSDTSRPMGLGGGDVGSTTGGSWAPSWADNPVGSKIYDFATAGDPNFNPLNAGQLGSALATGVASAEGVQPRNLDTLASSPLGDLGSAAGDVQAAESLGAKYVGTPLLEGPIIEGEQVGGTPAVGGQAPVPAAPGPPANRLPAGQPDLVPASKISQSSPDFNYDPIAALRDKVAPQFKDSEILMHGGNTTTPYRTIDPQRMESADPVMTGYYLDDTGHLARAWKQQGVMRAHVLDPSANRVNLDEAADSKFIQEVTDSVKAVVQDMNLRADAMPPEARNNISPYGEDIHLDPNQAAKDVEHWIEPGKSVWQQHDIGEAARQTGQPTKFDVMAAVQRYFQSSPFFMSSGRLTSQVLHNAGYDAIEYTGGVGNDVATDYNGERVPYKAVAVLPQSIHKLTNAVSGIRGS